MFQSWLDDPFKKLIFVSELSSLEKTSVYNCDFLCGVTSVLLFLLPISLTVLIAITLLFICHSRYQAQDAGAARRNKA